MSTIDDLMVEEIKAKPEIRFFIKEEDESKHPYDRDSENFFSVKCYCYDHGSPNLYKVDFKDREGVLSIIDLLLHDIENVSHYAADHVCNPHVFCGEEYKKKKDPISRMNCCTHYLIGIAMNQELAKAQDEVSEIIQEQGLTGIVNVDLMADFNMDKHELRVVAEYPGNSIDVYSIKAGAQYRNTNFIEFKDNLEADMFVYSFFHDI